MNPRKLIIEPTTRCNFSCRMCVKQSGGARIPEGDMDDAVFEALKPLFPHLESVIFTGIGAPLLCETLESRIAEAKAAMPEDAIRGFQTNGKLMTEARAVSLVKAGLNRVCVSVDASDPFLFNTLRSGGSLGDVEAALSALNRARDIVADSGLTIGIEFVLMKKNMDQLPRVADWAGKQGVDFILVTHLTAYHREIEQEQA
ncbi:MAG: radical SAM protein, partial [Desulfobacterales bacterium]|nr:radical SAM protein [Desulfobacterales bacterium]